MLKFHRFLILFVLASLTVAAAGLPFPAAEAQADDPGTLVFAWLAKGAPGGEGIYTIDADGSNQRPLLLFNDVGMPYDVYNGGYRCPTWSPDGSQVAFNGADGAKNFIAVANADGSRIRKIYEVETNDRTTYRVNYPEWVPGGQQVSFGFTEAERKTGKVTANGVRVVNLDGSGLATLVDDVTLTYYDGSPTYLSDVPNFLVLAHSWSPDGSQLAIAAYNDAVYLADADGSNRHKLESGDRASSDVDWSADGSLLASSLFRIMTYRPDDGGAREMLATPTRPPLGYHESLAWSPDGRQLAYATYYTDIQNGEFTVWQTLTIMDAATGAERVILETPKRTGRDYPTAFSCVDWRPGGAAPLPPAPPTPLHPPIPTPVARCTVSAARTVNLRAEPSNSADKVGSIAAGNSVEVDRQAEAEGYDWYRLTSGEWVRADVVSIDADCAGNID